MNILNTIEKEAAHNRKTMLLACILIVAVCGGITCFSIYTTMKSKEKIYALDNQNNVIIFNQVMEDRRAEAEGHFKAFHQLFFNLPPDGKIIEKNITKKALELIDKTGKVYYDRLMQSQFFNNLIVMNITQEIQIDSVKISNRHPYTAMLWGKIYMIGEETIKEKSLVTCGVLRNTNHRSPQNPHAFIIEKFQVMENKDLNEYKRR